MLIISIIEKRGNDVYITITPLRSILNGRMACKIMTIFLIYLLNHYGQKTVLNKRISL